MAIEVKQDSLPIAPHHWKWRLWLEGPSEDLDQIEYVLYVLHPTFHEPIRRAEDRQG
jgi:transcription initiation factor IIF auxiliary subunit